MPRYDRHDDRDLDQDPRPRARWGRFVPLDDDSLEPDDDQDSDYDDEDDDFSDDD